MSMYGMVFGSGSLDKAMICAALLMHSSTDVDVSDLRLRDAWIEKQPDGAPLIVLYTRNGGGNRECFCEYYASQEGFVRGTCTGCLGEAATRHPNFVRDQDDDFDCTYRTYWFTIPESIGADAQQKLIAVADDPVDTDARWLAAIDAIGKP